MDEKRAAILKEKGYIGKKVTLGIRPEDLHDESDSERGNKDACLNATIRVYEMLGAETFLYFDMDTATWTARVNPSVRVKPAKPLSCTWIQRRFTRLIRRLRTQFLINFKTV